MAFFGCVPAPFLLALHPWVMGISLCIQSESVNASAGVGYLLVQ